MIRINPFTTSWCNQFLYIPLLEGSARIVDRFYYGAERSWKERTVSLLTGASLCVPLIGAIVWIFWEAFGEPERLHVVPIKIPPAPAPVAVAPPPTTALPEEIEYDDTVWRIVKETDGTAIAQCRYKQLDIQTTAWYREGQLQKLIRVEGSTLIDMQLNGDRLTASSGGQTKTHVLPKGVLWVQQLTRGLESFFRSNEKELIYCSINPKPTISKMGRTIEFLSLVEMKARKVGPGEIEFFASPPRFMETVYKQAFLGHIWFDPKTFVVTKIRTEGLLGVKEDSTLISPQTDLSPQ